ncbi:MAG: hypothetical protein IKV68_03280, partial [Oscillospiraceae bacterium]|nr:hypothetical protein [Oscillospiraceae bacterium]
RNLPVHRIVNASGCAAPFTRVPSYITGNDCVCQYFFALFYKIFHKISAVLPKLFSPQDFVVLPLKHPK